MTDEPEPSATAIPNGRLWKNNDFLKLWAGQTLSVVGSSVTDLALPTLAILQLHADAWQVGVLAALQKLPFVFFSLFAGVLVDRIRRRPIMIACDAARALLLISVPVAAVAHALVLQQLFAVAFLLGVFTVFFDIAYLAYLPALVSPRQLMEGNTKLQSTLSIGGVAGPGVAGLLIQLDGAAMALLADAFSYLASVILVIAIRAREGIAPVARADRQSVLSDIKEGVRWVFGEPVLRSEVIGIGLGGFGFYLVVPVIFIFAYRNLHLSPALVGAVFVIEGACGLIGLRIAPWVVARLGLGRTFWVTQVVISVSFMCIPLAAWAPPMLVLSPAFFFIGVMGMVQDVNQVTLRMSRTPSRLQGRMNATFRLVYWGIAPFAAVSGGALATWLGAAPAIVIGGALALAAAALMAFSPMGRLRAHVIAEAE